jgi:hypothetical protein
MGFEILFFIVIEGRRKKERERRGREEKRGEKRREEERRGE